MVGLGRVLGVPKDFVCDTKEFGVVGTEHDTGVGPCEKGTDYSSMGSVGATLSEVLSRQGRKGRT